MQSTQRRTGSKTWGKTTSGSLNALRAARCVRTLKDALLCREEWNGLCYWTGNDKTEFWMLTSFSVMLRATRCFVMEFAPPGNALLVKSQVNTNTPWLVQRWLFHPKSTSLNWIWFHFRWICISLRVYMFRCIGVCAIVWKFEDSIIPSKIASLERNWSESCSIQVLGLHSWTNLVTRRNLTGLVITTKKRFLVF